LPGADLPALRAAFARALAVEASDRFETAHELAAALNAAFPGYLPVTNPRTGNGPEDRSPVEMGGEAGLRPVPTGAAAAMAAGATAERTAELTLRAPDTTPDTTPGATPDPLGELELRAAETARYPDVTTIPEAVAAPAPSRTATHREPPRTHPSLSLSLLDGYQPDSLELTVEPAPRPPVWPVAAALMAGIALGFGGGYTFAGRRPAAARAAVAATPPGREWTEGAVTPSRSGAVQPEPAATVHASAGRLLVGSMPAGAQVFVDGREKGRTPATVLDLTLGAHRVRVTRAGYVAEDRRVVVTAERPTQSVTVQLKPPAGAGVAEARTPAGPSPVTTGAFTEAALSVDSRPRGAKVFIDGRLVGTTPVSIPHLSGGEHAIRLERDGYRRWSSSIRIAAGEPGRVTASLEK
jgi:hypothetical protein